MASVSTSSTTSSSSISGDSDDLSLDLQPAPLRLLRHRTGTNLDGSKSVGQEQMSAADDDPSADPSALAVHIDEDSTRPPPRPAVAKAPSQRRPPAPKLGSLVSKFEILDAVNSAEASSPLRPKPSGIPRVQATLGRRGDASEALQKIASRDKHSAAGNSADVSPRQVVSPPPAGSRSKLPVSTLFKPMTGEHSPETTSASQPHKNIEGIALIADRRRVFENKGTYSPFAKPAGSTLEQSRTQNSMSDFPGSSTHQLSRSDSSRQNSPTKSKLQIVSSASPLKTSQQVDADGGQQGNCVVEQSPAKKHGSPTLSKIPIKREQPSVADLRKSFEKGSQPPRQAPQTPSKPKPPSDVAPDRTARSSKETPRLSGSIGRGSTPSVRTATRDKSTSVQAPLGVAGRTARAEPKNKPSEQSLLARSAVNTVRHAPRISLPKSSRFRQRDVSNLDGAASFEQDDTVDGGRLDGGRLDEDGITDASHAPATRDGESFPGFPGFPDSDLIHPFLSANSIDGLHRELPGGRPVSHEETVSGQIGKTLKKPASKPETATKCTGKVSDLRRFFERAPIRGSSPNPFKSFWQYRSRNKPKVKVREVPATTYDEARSPITATANITASTTNIPLLKRISLPELTTTISTDDFSCDFAVPGTQGDASSIKIKPCLDIEPDENMPTEQESPVRGRIQQFERLERGSPTSSPTSLCRAKSYGANMTSSFGGKENDAKQIKTRASWHPFRQRSIELWRRISNSFVRSAGGGNNSGSDSGGNEEQAGLGNHANIDDAGPSSLRRRLRYRRSDIFSYHLYRSSEVVRSPTASSRGKSSVSIDDDLVARIENQPPHLTYRRSPSRDISISRTFPFLTRTSDSLRSTDEFDGFGFDGSLLSKAARYRPKSPAAQIPQSSSLPTTRGDPSTLSKVVSQQTVAERKRRRLEEKQLRREQRDKKREEKAKAKGKEKATGNGCGENSGQEAAAAQDKGKGKEVEGKKKESSWSKKTASGFVVRQISDVKLRHPKPRRPGQVKKLVNMYKEKTSSGIKLGKGSGASSGSGAAGPTNQ
ncbi:hypothetical protein F4781DRAFT_422980 [Annulohypoxylon bovei var. microspora]|nr:hypothetical protein F4781DRAFT_422980 [Annulohypoxylon bovei var. microspora]